MVWGLFRRNTEVAEPFFRMRLPGKWSRRVDVPDERWNYNTGREQLTVSVRVTDHPLSHPEQAEMISKYIALRREAETTGAIEVEMSEAVPAVVGDVHLTRYAVFTGRVGVVSDEVTLCELFSQISNPHGDSSARTLSSAATDRVSIRSRA